MAVGLTAGIWRVAALGALLVLLVAPSTARAATWDIQKLQVPPRYPGDFQKGALHAISCTSRSFCLAGGDSGRLLVSANPAGGPSTWRHFYVPPGTDSEGGP